MPKRLNTVYLVDGIRTPFLVRPDTKPQYTALDLAVLSSRALMLRHAFALGDIDAVVMSSGKCDEHTNYALQLLQRLNCNKPHQASTLNLFGESSGFKGLEYACQQIALGQQELLLLGGVDLLDALNNSPSKHNPYTQLTSMLPGKGGEISKKVREKYQSISQHIAGHRDAQYAHSKHQHYQQLSEQQAITLKLTPEHIEDYIQLSQRRVQYAQRNKLLASVTPIFYPNGEVVHRDQGISLNARLHTSHPQDFPAETDPYTPLLPPTAIAPPGTGACMLLLASEASVKRFQLPVLARLSSPAWATNTQHSNDKLTVNSACNQVIENTRLSVDAIDYWEINEHAAVDVLAAQQHNNQYPNIASLSHVNIDGGALTLGNPVAANALRMVLQLAHILKRENAQHGIVTSHFADSQTFALLVRNAQQPASKGKTA